MTDNQVLGNLKTQTAQMSPFACTLEGFKVQTKKFLDHIGNPNISLAALAQAGKAVNLYYLNLQANECERFIAATYWQFVQNAYTKRLVEERA